MPRCRIIQPVPQSIKRYLPRRSTARTVRPQTCLARSRGMGQRSARLRTITASMRWPCMCGARPRLRGFDLWQFRHACRYLFGDNARVEQATPDLHAEVVAHCVVAAHQLEVRLLLHNAHGHCLAALEANVYLFGEPAVLVRLDAERRRESPFVGPAIEIVLRQRLSPSPPQTHRWPPRCLCRRAQSGSGRSRKRPRPRPRRAVAGSAVWSHRW